MADRFIVSNIQRLPFFEHLQAAEIERLADYVQVMRRERGELIFRQGETAQGLYMMVSGKAALLQQQADGTHKQFATVTANQYLNEDALRGPKTETASLYVIEPAVVLFLSRDSYYAFVREMTTARGQIPVDSGSARTSPNTASGSRLGARIPVRHDELVNRRNPPTNPPPDSSAQNNHNLPTGGPATVQTPQGDTVYAAGTEVDPRFIPNHQRYTVPPGANIDQPIAYPDEPVGSQSIFEAGVNPNKRTFEGKRPTEDVLFMTRRHGWAVFRQIWKPLIVFTLMVIVGVVADNPLIRASLFGLAFIVPGLLIFYFFLEWRNDWLIITDERVLHIEKNLLTVQTQISEIPIKSVQAVQAEISPNVLARIFGVGKVEINTAGGRGNIVVDALAQADRIKDFVFKQRTKLVQAEESERQRQLIQQELDRMMGNETQQPPMASQPLVQEPVKHPVGPQSFLDTRYFNSDGNIVFRRHWIVWLQHVTLPAMIFLGAVLAIILSFVIPAFEELTGMTLVLAFVAMIVSAVWFYYGDWDWRNDLIILSDTMITIIHRRPLWLQYEDDQVLLDRIDNTTADTGGPLRALLGYGNVKILLVGDEKPKVFSRVPNPRAMREEISKFQSNARRAAQDAADRRHLSATLESIYAYHNRYNNGEQTPPEGQPPQQPANQNNPNYRR